MNRYTKWATTCVAALILSGCSQEPTGQVAAIVGGDEITLQEINGELSQMQLPAGTDQELARSLALNRVVERRLLANVARNEGLDQTPEYFIRQRQLIDSMLVQQLSTKLQRGVAVPTEQQIQDYVREHPESFESRKLLRVDQIQFEMPSDPDDLKKLENDHSMDEVAESLGRLGIEFQRRPSQLDTALLGGERLAQIRALPAGEPFILPGPRIVTIAVLKGETDAPKDSEGLAPMVAERLQREELANLLQSRLAEAKDAANIQYQDGFAPPPNPSE